MPTLPEKISAACEYLRAAHASSLHATGSAASAAGQSAGSTALNAAPPVASAAGLGVPAVASAGRTADDIATPLAPEVGLILGTGLGPIAGGLQVEAEIPYADIPHFARATVDGHDGKWLFGKLAGKNAVVMQGRLHYYEGHSMEDIAFPVRVMRALGARSLIITNIAGGVNASFRMGDLMAITDHINLLPGNPLIGPNHDSIGPRFPDMSRPYHGGYLGILRRAAQQRGIALREGVYACMTGPCLETAAEYRMLRIIGADAVGMSTVPEVIAAVHCGLSVAALSLITDVCDPDNLQPINIPEIMRVAAEAEPKLAALVRDLAAGM